MRATENTKGEAGASPPWTNGALRAARSGQFAGPLDSALGRCLDLLHVIRLCGRNSIVIYLAFFLPMAVTRIALVKSGIITDPGTVAFLVTSVAVITPLVVHRLVRGTALSFLFERPARFHLSQPKTHTLQPAE